MTGAKRAAGVAAKIACALIIVAVLVVVTRMLSQSIVRDAAASEAEATTSATLRAFTGPIEDDERTTLIENLAAAPVKYAEHVPEVLQGDAYPSGCEPAALASVLQSMDMDASLEDVLGYLNYDPDFIDFVYHYAGDPAGSGSAWPPAMVDAANRYLDSASSANYAAININGASFSEVIDIISAGYPVMVWTTMYMEEPEFSDYTIFWYQFVVNNHCVVVCGLTDNGESVQVMDPLEGIVERNATDFARIYEERGCLAMIVVPTSAIA